MNDYRKANGNTLKCDRCGHTYSQVDGSCCCDPDEYEAMIRREVKELMKNIKWKGGKDEHC